MGRGEAEITLCVQFDTLDDRMRCPLSVATLSILLCSEGLLSESGVCSTRGELLHRGGVLTIDKLGLVLWSRALVSAVYN